MANFIFKVILCVILLCSNCFIASGKSIDFSEKNIKLEAGMTKTVMLLLKEPLNNDAAIHFTYEIGSKGSPAVKNRSLLEKIPDVTIPAHQSGVAFDITALRAGHVIIGINSSSKELQNLKAVFIRVEVVHSAALNTANSAFGWIYFTAWSLSLYPQVYENWSRNSVVGLNFDYVLYNVFGFLSYSCFNVGMYWIPTIQESYMKIHPRGINPVQLNDVFFTLHAVLLTSITAIQCFIYERGDQRLSRFNKVLMTSTVLFLLLSFGLAGIGVVTWLTYLYFFSYVKHAITFIKYVPQAYLNYSRKSTEGWSIGTIFLDFTGGNFCVLQMCLLAYNSDDWDSITGYLPKMGVAVFTLCFDCVFFIQHYGLYRHRSSDKAIDEESELLQVTSLR